MPTNEPDFEKKQKSVFSGILPTSSPASSGEKEPATRIESKEDISALKKRIDEMEKKILTYLQKIPPETEQQMEVKKLKGSQKDESASDLSGKVVELERKIRELETRKLSPYDLKTIEDFRISGRMEIEELLKAVREQQKYSELDRQMHEQIEKAWERVDSLEKRLLNLYETIVHRPKTEENTKSSIESIIDNKLNSVYKEMVDFQKQMQENLNDIISKKFESFNTSFEHMLSNLEEIDKKNIESIIDNKLNSVYKEMADFQKQMQENSNKIFEDVQKIKDILFKTDSKLTQNMENYFKQSNEKIEKINIEINADLQKKIEEISYRMDSKLNENMIIISDNIIMKLKKINETLIEIIEVSYRNVENLSRQFNENVNKIFISADALGKILKTYEGKIPMESNIKQHLLKIQSAVKELEDSKYSKIPRLKCYFSLIQSAVKELEDFKGPNIEMEKSMTTLKKVLSELELEFSKLKPALE